MKLRRDDIRGYLWLGIFCMTWVLPAVTADEELAHIEDGADIDFSKGDILAEIPPGGHMTADVDLKTSQYLETSTANEMTDSSNPWTRLAMTGKSTEEWFHEGARLGRLREESTQESTTNDSAVTAETTKAMTEKVSSTEAQGLPTTQTKVLNDDLLEEVPPHITYPVTQELIIVNSHQTQFRLQCVAEGRPKPVYSWYKDGRQLNMADPYVKAYGNGTLFIQGFSNRENGYYQCRATNRNGLSVSVEVHLVAETATAPIVPDGSEIFREIKVRQSDAASLPCANTPPTFPERVRRWYLTTDTREVIMNERLGTDSLGTLRFAYAEPQDIKIYLCALVPSEAQAQASIFLYNQVSLKVESAAPKERAPKQEYVSSEVKAVIGLNVTLDCFFSGYPVPKITWTNTSNHEISMSDQHYRITDYGRKLVIVGVQQRDEGTFGCKADNGFGVKSAVIAINVTTPPMRIQNQILPTLTVPDDKDVTLECKARVALGEHMETPRWYRNGELLQAANLPDPKRYRFNEDLSELHITDLVKYLDTAGFQCNISNSEGYLFNDGYLRVIDAIEIDRRPEEVVIVSRDNQAVDISVAAKGDSCCVISQHWKLNDAILGPDVLERPPFIWRKSIGSLMINASAVSNSSLPTFLGRYECRVSNAHDYKVVSFSVKLAETVLPTSQPQTAGEPEFAWWWIAILGGVLAVIVAVVVIVILIRHNYPGETYQLEKTELKHHLNPEEDLLNQSFQEI